MEGSIENLTDTVSRLLSEENKNKSIGEVSEELSEYLVNIKELVESNQISYEVLKKEIEKHIDFNKNIKPGSIGQLLVGCMVGSECAMSKETPEDIAFAYDSNKNVILPLTRLKNPISEKSYCVLYINGIPSDISLDSLKTLENAGFKKIKIKHKNLNETSYKTLDIEDINKYIESKSQQDTSKYGIVISGILLTTILMWYLYSNKTDKNKTEKN